MKTDTFVHRHIGPNEEEIQFMLNKIGADSIDQLLEETLPSSIRLKSPLPIDKGISEYAFSKHIHQLGKENDRFDTYIGMGYHAAITPAVIQRNVLENPGWYTAYTPYQAEIAQGRLEALFNFQSLITDLTGMELANASLLDESTAAAEAMTMLFGTRTKEQKQAEATHFFVDENTLPQTLSLLKTRALPLGITLVVGYPDTHEFDAHFFGAIFQYPGKHGAIPNLKQWIEKANTKGVFTVVAADIMSLVLLESPGHYGADVVLGTSQRFGIPLGYGGPHAAFFATREHYKRNIPGRIIGQTRDLDENPALRMALQTREQHIKRDRATSNICTAQVLLAVMAGMYAVYHGPKGLRAIAEGIHKHTVLLNNNLIALGITQKNDYFFDTLHCEVRSAELKTIAEQKEINFYYPDSNSVSISINETTTEEDVLKIVSVFKQYLQKDHLLEAIPASSSFLLGERKTSYLTHPVFNSYHSETALMRYIKSLERKDLALNQSMISLGSCTMKLNAATEMFPLSDPNWGAIHPFVPIEQAKGYQKMLTQLSDDLTKITGFAATSLQPNSGAQGEYAGLMVIRAFHEANKQSHRTICLIPASAHGTNPASAVMAGMQVVVTVTDEKGNIDFEDLKEKALLHKENLAALMITYPSTHGVFESKIKDITQLIHDCGGQVYMDGANMNAQVGLTSPG
ncbi:MAG: aminomethyl-transferring glycine dehydrogenase, partial [Flavobacteriaceae bacterium]